MCQETVFMGLEKDRHSQIEFGGLVPSPLNELRGRPPSEVPGEQRSRPQ